PRPLPGGGDVWTGGDEHSGQAAVRSVKSTPEVTPGRATISDAATHTMPIATTMSPRLATPGNTGIGNRSASQARRVPGPASTYALESRVRLAKSPWRSGGRPAVSTGIRPSFATRATSFNKPPRTRHAAWYAP